MRMKSGTNPWTLTILFSLSILTIALVAQQSNSLTIAGQTGSAKVIQVNGRNYVEVESLARLTNSSLSFNGNQIILNMGGGSANSPATSNAPEGFSRDFLTAGIEAMAQIREWHAALRNAIERGTPVSNDWLVAYRNQAQQAVRLASVTVNTGADKNAMPLLTSEFNSMGKLTDKYVGIADSRTYIPTDSLANDVLEQKIRNCGRSLAAMASSNQFSDDGSCTTPVPAQ
jgi:hypothetical protein